MCTTAQEALQNLDPTLQRAGKPMVQAKPLLKEKDRQIQQPFSTARVLQAQEKLNVSFSLHFRRGKGTRD